MIATHAIQTSVVVIGAGPSGIDVGLRLHRAGVPLLVLEQGDLAATIRDWPPGTKMFSPQVRVAVGDLPFPPALSARDHLTREEYVQYLADAVHTSGLPALTHHAVTSIRTLESGFEIDVQQRGATDRKRLHCTHVVFATGCMHAPLALGVPGETLPFVRHLPGLDFDAISPKSVCVVGGRHSAVEASLRFVERGSEVTLIYRRKNLYRMAIKSWLYDQLMQRMDEGRIRFLGSTEVTGFDPDGRVGLRSSVDGRPTELHCDLALVACGFTYDASLLVGLGMAVDGLKPKLDPSTLESDVRDVFVVGTAIAGQQQSGYTHDIDNVSGHGALVANEIVKRLESRQ